MATVPNICMPRFKEVFIVCSFQVGHTRPLRSKAVARVCCLTDALMIAATVPLLRESARIYLN